MSVGINQNSKKNQNYVKYNTKNIAIFTRKSSK